MDGQGAQQSGMPIPLMNTYGSRERVMVRGEGIRLFDAAGREYLDMLSGLGVNNLGHCHPAIVEAVREQAGTLIHACNLYLIEPQIELARTLCRLSGFDKAFFCNSGAESVDGALKLARLRARLRGETNRTAFVAMDCSFHGRTYGAAGVSAPMKVREGFGPMPGETRFARFNDIADVEQLADEQVCAIIVEPVAGEGGVLPADPDFLQGLRRIADDRNITLIFDEVQCGLGRIGKPFAFEHYGVKPDVLTLAKGLAGGLPMGAILALAEHAEVFTPGKHGATFGGNPLSARAALAYLAVLEQDRLWERVSEIGAYFKEQLMRQLGGLKVVREVRGLGFMLGIELTLNDAAPVVEDAAECGLLVNATAGNVIRLLPPFIITRDECDQAAGILYDCLTAVPSA